MAELSAEVARQRPVWKQAKQQEKLHLANLAEVSHVSGSLPFSFSFPLCDRSRFRFRSHCVTGLETLSWSDSLLKVSPITYYIHRKIVILYIIYYVHKTHGCERWPPLSLIVTVIYCIYCLDVELIGDDTVT